jgi:cytoskeletal protein RodZ
MPRCFNRSVVGRLFRILVCISICGALGATPALAQSPTTSTTPSAGDNQYIDPLATPAKPHHHHRAKPKESTTSPSASNQVTTTSASTSASQTPPGTATVPTPTAAPTTTAHTVTAHHHHKKRAAKKATSSAPKQTATAPPVSAAPASPVSAPSRNGSTFPYLYLILAACAAVAVGLLGRRMLFRRAVRRA